MYVINKKKRENLTLLISKSVQEIFRLHRQIKCSDVEACGVLIGNHRIEGNSIYLKLATAPQTKDTRRRYAYKIDPSSHQNILEKYFKTSGNEDVYLGTWHTHPEKNPIPSNDDIIDWKKQYSTNKNLFYRMIFIIVGIQKTKYWMIENCSLFELLGREIIHE